MIIFIYTLVSVYIDEQLRQNVKYIRIKICLHIRFQK